MAVRRREGRRAGAEAAGGGPEALARWAWEGQRWSAPLCTVEGLALKVEDPGRRRWGPGPDYQGARLHLGGRLLEGDVELHGRQGDWEAHGHRWDPAYRGVILHVVLEAEGKPTLRCDGTTVPLLAVGELLEGPWSRLAPLAEGDSHRCAACRRGVQALGEGSALALLAQLGVERLRRKAAELVESLELWGPERTLYERLLAGLGRPGGRAPLAALASRVPWDGVQGMAGAEGVGRALMGAWGEGAVLGRAGRPAGDPERRLGGLAALLSRWGPALASFARRLVGEGWGALERALLVPGAIGAGGAMELAANAVLPWAVADARARGLPDLEEQAVVVFCAYPRRQDYGATRRLARALLGEEGTRRIATLAQLQGLLHLERTLCPGGRCPFASAQAQGGLDIKAQES